MPEFREGLSFLGKPRQTPAEIVDVPAGRRMDIAVAGSRCQIARVEFLYSDRLIQIRVIRPISDTKTALPDRGFDFVPKQLVPCWKGVKVHGAATPGSVFLGNKPISTGRACTLGTTSRGRFQNLTAPRAGDKIGFGWWGGMPLD
jgi:hypothetical protein